MLKDLCVPTYFLIKAADVLRITGISRRHLSSLVKQGQFRVTVKPNAQYDYNPEDVYKYIGKERRNLKLIYARVSTPKQKSDLARQIETLENFCLAQYLKIDRVFSDIASGINARKAKTVL
jgi:putative resolvase